jgi:serine phosphatase RsbU (regulator of sigma subunit)
MPPGERGPAAGVEPASLVVIDPSGNRGRVPLDALPFLIGRQPESNLIVRDSRASRTHSRIVAEDGRYILEDCASRHGTFVNGARVTRHKLENGDRIEFGVPDSYQLLFALDGAELKILMEQMGAAEKPASAPHGVGGNLAKLRAILDLARTLQGSFSVEDVLAQVVDAALAIAGAERGFLMLRKGDELETRVARNRHGRTLNETELRVPKQVLHRALQHRRELLSMNFDPLANHETKPDSHSHDRSVVSLELRSVICVPLVRIRAGQGNDTVRVTTTNETVGLLYMDSKVSAADLAGGNRELLQTLAIEASTVLENARLLEEERGKRLIEEELNLARSIQQSLLPRALPADGWLRACGSSMASREVGGDYFDAAPVNEECWSAVVVDVSGKGVSSALLASLLQGALIAASHHPEAMSLRMHRLNRFLLERTGGEKYATVFQSLLHRNGKLNYINAAHCPPMVIRADGGLSELEVTGMPVGMMEGAEFALAEAQLAKGDKLLIYSDGVTEAQNAAGEFFGKRRLRAVLAANAAASAAVLHDAVQESVTRFTGGAAQSDDITVLVLEFAA